MEINWGEILLGAGGASTVIGAIVLRKINKTMDNLDSIPIMAQKLKDLKDSIDAAKMSVDGFSGELRALERSMYQNSKDIALTSQKVDAAFREVDGLKASVRDMKI